MTAHHDDARGQGGRRDTTGESGLQRHDITSRLHLVADCAILADDALDRGDDDDGSRARIARSASCSKHALALVPCRGRA